MKVEVTSKEVLQFDPMVHQVIKQEILQYWGNRAAVYSTRNEVLIGRLGMSFDDLMQYGREIVFKQIKWFKKHGVDPKTGKPKDAKMSTLLFGHLRKKFMSLSKSAACKKNGGLIINVETSRQNIQSFIDRFDNSTNITTNKNKLREALMHVKTAQKLVSKRTSNKQLLKFAQETLLELTNVSHVNYDDVSDLSWVNKQMTPESSLLVKEEIDMRIKNYCEKNDLDSITVQNYVKRCKYTPPSFLTKGKITTLMKMARKKGIKSQRQFAKKLKIGMSTLSNILRGRSRGTPEFRTKIEQMFGKKIEDLLKVVKE